MIPMMSDQEVKTIDQLLVGKRHCLEWGAGGSTVYFPKKHKACRWLSVEHNGNWVMRVAEEIADNANVIWVPENEWYVDSVKHSREFDFILIDGLQRERCLEIARNIVSDDGVIVLHDAGRREYQEFIEKHSGEIISEGEEPFEGYYKHRGLAVFHGA